MLESLTRESETEVRTTIPILGRDTPEHARAIQNGVNIEGVTVQVIEQRDDFKDYTQVPETVPDGEVLIFCLVPPDKTVELMKQMSAALNNTEA